MNTMNLSESLKAIQKSGKSTDEKKAMCLKLGLRPRDVEYLEFQGFFRGVTLTFGVEIECDVDRDRVSAEAGRHGLSFSYERYNHETRKWFKFVPDGSVHGSNPIECVSPVLEDTEAGFSALKVCCDTLNAAGARVNRSCGLHVHVGAQGLTGAQIVRVFKNYQMIEGLVDSFMAPSRRGDCQWAQSMLRVNLEGCRDADDIYHAFGHDRYHKVNPCSFRRHGTIEFRQHQGTVDYDKISRWVTFCCKLVAWSRENEFTAPVADVNGLEFLDESERAWFKARQDHFATI